MKNLPQVYVLVYDENLSAYEVYETYFEVFFLTKD